MITEYEIKTLSGRGKDITYHKMKDYYDVLWGETPFRFDYKTY